MGHELIEIGDGFWNIRGSFRLFGLLDIGTHCSLVRLRSGRFVMLDSYTLEDDVREQVLGLTDGGETLEAVIHLHPFHTVHVKPMARMFPDAKQYGTARHHAKKSDVRWEPELTESPELAALYADDLDFLVPRGVDFIPSNEKLHFASVLAIHDASQTLHVDDTLNWTPLPWDAHLGFHPTLKKVLEPRPEAAAEFRAWAEALADRCEEVRNVCTAHARSAPLRNEAPGVVADHIRKALRRVDKTLRAHERR